MENFIKKIREDLNRHIPLSDEFYTTLNRYLFLKKRKRREIISSPDQKRKCSLYICQGYVGVYKLQQGKEFLILVFKEKNLVHDWIKYSSEPDSQILVKAITDTVYLEFSLSDLRFLILRHPETFNLILVLNHRIQVASYHFMELIRKEFIYGYSAFCHCFPGIQGYLNYSDWASLFSTSTRTVGRVLSQKPKVNYPSSKRGGGGQRGNGTSMASPRL